MFDNLEMEMTTQRLYLAAKQLRGIEGQSALARFLDETPQVLKNWETRGVSKNGMIKAEERIGCTVTWLKTGEGRMIATSNDPGKEEIDRIIQVAQEEIALCGKKLDEKTTLRVYRSAIFHQTEFDISEDELRQHVVSLIK